MIKKDDSRGSLHGNGTSTAKLQKSSGTPAVTTADSQATGLYIDSRKPKRPLGSESYQIEAPNADLNEYMNNFQLQPKDQ